MQIISECFLRVFGYDLVLILTLPGRFLAGLLSGKNIPGVCGGSCFYDSSVALFAQQPVSRRRMGGVVRGWGGVVRSFLGVRSRLGSRRYGRFGNLRYTWLVSQQLPGSEVLIWLNAPYWRSVCGGLGFSLPATPKNFTFPLPSPQKKLQIP